MLMALATACGGSGDSSASASASVAAPSGLPTNTPLSSPVTPRPATEEPADTPSAAATPTATPVASAPATPTASPILEPAEFVLTSSAFTESDPIPARFTCDGADEQLPLEWSGAPEGTVEFALIQHDPDAGGFVHWVVVGIPADATSLGTPLPDGARHGTNGFGRTRYSGPCPPSGNHTYVTTLVALSEPLDLPEAPTARQVRQAIENTTLAQAQLRGTYRRT